MIIQPTNGGGRLDLARKTGGSDYEAFTSGTVIPAYAFYEDSNLTNITMPNVMSIGDYAFYNCTELTDVTIPTSVTSIGGFVFYGCTGLTSVTIPDSVTSIGNSAFRNCTGLASIIMPDSITVINGSTFFGCTSLASITIPNYVTNIGSFAFYNCIRLEYVDLSELDHTPTLEAEVFYNTTCTFLFRDQAQLNEFANATNWSVYADRFQVRT